MRQNLFFFVLQVRFCFHLFFVSFCRDGPTARELGVVFHIEQWA